MIFGKRIRVAIGSGYRGLCILTPRRGIYLGLHGVDYRNFRKFTP